VWLKCFSIIVNNWIACQILRVNFSRPLDLGDDYPIVFTILSAFATFERERIAARIREVKQLKKAQGKFTGGKRAFGYEVIDGVKVAKPDEQTIIDEMRGLRQSGKTFREISSWLSLNYSKDLTFMGVRHVLSAAGGLNQGQTH